MGPSGRTDSRPVDDLSQSETSSTDAPDAVERSRRGPIRWPVAAEWLLLLASPVVAFRLFEVEPFFRQNGVDPFMYIGYAWDGEDLWARYGPKYYPVRFALTLPIRLTTALFGVEGGYFVMRYLIVVASAIALYLPLRKLGGRAAGWLGVALLLWNPVFLRAVMTTYSDTTGLPATFVFFAALLLAVGRDRGRAPLMVIAGVAYGAAIHSNPILVVVSGTILLPWAVAELRRRRARLLIDAALVVAGVAAVTALGVLYFRVRFGDADIFSPSIDAARSLSGEQGKAFRAPDNAWLAYRFHLYLPPVVLLAWFVTRWRRWRSVSPIEGVMVATLALMSAFFVLHQFVLESSTLETYYYTSYLVVPLLFVSVTVIAGLIGTSADRHGGLWWIVAASVAFPLLRNWWFRRLEFEFLPAVPIIVVGVVALVAATRLAVGRRSASGMALAASGSLVVATGLLLLAAPFAPPLSRGQSFRFDPHYELAIGNSDDSGLEWYELTFDLINHTPPLAAPGEHVLFWYEDGPPMLNALQSAYLWRSSAWQSTFEGMPFIDDWRIARLRDEQVRFLVLLGETPTQIDRGVAALRRAGIGIDWQKRTTFTEGGSVLYFNVVRIIVPPA